MDDRTSHPTTSGPGPDRSPDPHATRRPPPEDRSTRLQILSIENATLLAHRSQLWSDGASRAAVYLAVLSGAVVAIALAAQATAFGHGFVVFALLLLPVVLYAGLVTLGRLAELNHQDFQIVQALNRVQHGLLELDPGVEPYLASSPHDDWLGISNTFAVEREVGGRNEVAHGLKTLPALFAVINCAVAAVLAAVIALELGFAALIVVGASVVVFVLLFVVQMRTLLRSVMTIRTQMVSYFPTPATHEDQPSPEG